MQKNWRRTIEIVVNLETNVANLNKLMLTKIEVRKAKQTDRETLKSLLDSERLPTSDLPTSLDNFFVVADGDQIIGGIGLEQYDNCGLLRSLVVAPSYRNQNIAAKLIDQLEISAAGIGIGCIYLLTETAPGYFDKKGYERISRNEVPVALQKSSEFSHVCPTSAIVMKKPMK